MSFELLDEHEQSELVRKWLRENALSIVVGIVLGLLLIFGWQQWKSHRATQLAQAAAQYQALVAAVTARHEQDVQTIARTLRDETPDGVYSVLAALQQAEIASLNGDMAAAAEALDWADRHAGDPAMKDLVALRLARVKLAEGDAEGAIKLLDGITSEAYAGMVGEVRGDALMKLGRSDAARSAYEGALAHLDPQAPGRPIVQMKLDDLAPAVAAAAPAPATPATAPAAPAATPEKSDS
ncbi:YfgM family protein [Dokdonella sp.]|uniref:YfgM family protein n=1 Tax=Dokdonella sp. TaxID=2291710 RepID=UPI0031C09C11|nr:tetratricopeptide repeat protein [Dokdonella sp.]